MTLPISPALTYSFSDGNDCSSTSKKFYPILLRTDGSGRDLGQNGSSESNIVNMHN